MSATLPKELSIAARNLAPPPNFLSLASRPDIISFAGGVPDPALFPYETLSAATNAVFADKDLRRSAMQYAPSIGYPGLRIWLQHYMKQLGVHADHDQIIVTNGAQQGLDLIGKMLIDPGDEIAITAPTFFAALETFNVYRPKYLSVPFANGRLDMDAAKSIISRRPKFFYVIPEFQNPTGSSLDLDQRNELIRLCAEHDVLIVEDAAYERLSFDNDRPPSLLQLAQTMQVEEFGQSPNDAGVLYVNTFSKTIAPGLRVGWFFAGQRFAEKAQALKLSGDVHTSLLNQMLVLHVVENEFEDHVRKIQSVYSERCSAMLQALEKHMPDTCRWSTPTGGLFVWLELPQHIDASALLSVALSEAKVAFVPGSMSFNDGSGRNACRLTFATAEPDVIQDGLKRFGKLLQVSERVPCALS